MTDSISPPTVRGTGSLPFPQHPPGTANGEMPFDHLVIVMMENHSFDNLLGAMSTQNPNVDGLTFDSSGRATNSNPGSDGAAVKAEPFSDTAQPKGITQSWAATHDQIDNGRMDGFVKTSGDGAMGYYPPDVLPFAYSLAGTFTVANRWFSSVPGPTYPNRRFLLAGTAWGLTATDVMAMLKHPVPPNGTIFDLLSRHHISWSDYFSDIPMSLLIPSATIKHFDHHHHIDKFFHDCATGGLPSVSFVDPPKGVLSSIAQAVDSMPGIVKDLLKTLGIDPSSFPKAGTEEDPEDMYSGESWAYSIVDAVLQSPAWERTLLIYTYDEHGGYFDHVLPPRTISPDQIPPTYPPPERPGGYDSYGPRVPAVVASPYAIPGGVTNVTHDHTSILATIEAKWNLPALSNRDANAATLMDFLNPHEAALAKPPVLRRPASTGPSGPAPEKKSAPADGMNATNAGS